MNEVLMYLANGPHQNLLELTAVKTNGDTKALATVMPLCDASWADLIVRKQAALEADGRTFTGIPVFSEAEMAAGYICVLNGLHHSHTRGNAHLDLKPANVMVVLDGDMWTSKICDFGLAKKFGSSVQRRWGTQGYMAPELWNLGDGNGVSSASVGPEMDVYSASMMFATIMLGCTPDQIQDLARTGALQAHLPGSRSFAAAVSGGLATCPSARASLDDLLQAAQDVLDRLNTVSLAPTPLPDEHDALAVQVAAAALPNSTSSESPSTTSSTLGSVSAALVSSQMCSQAVQVLPTQHALSTATVNAPPAALPPAANPLPIALPDWQPSAVLRPRRCHSCGSVPRARVSFAAFAEATPSAYIPTGATTAADIPAAYFPPPVALPDNAKASCTPTTPRDDDTTPASSVLPATPPWCGSPGAPWPCQAQALCSSHPAAAVTQRLSEAAHGTPHASHDDEQEPHQKSSVLGEQRAGTPEVEQAEMAFAAVDVAGGQVAVTRRQGVAGGMHVGRWCALAVAAGLVGLVAVRVALRRH